LATFSSCKIEVTEESDCVFSRHTAHHVCLTGRQVPLPRQFLFMVRGEPDAYCVSDRSGCSLGDSGDFTFGSFAMPGLTLFVLLRQPDEYYVSDKSDCSFEDTGDIICTVPCHASAVCVRQGSPTRTVSDRSDCSFRDSGDITFGSFAMPDYVRAFKAARRVLSV